MSQRVAKTPCQISNLDALDAAARKLGCQVLKQAKARAWGSQKIPGERVYTHPNSPFDVAVNKQSGKDTYQLEADLHGGHIQKVYGTPESTYGRLVTLYGAEEAKKILTTYGYTVYETRQKDGRIAQKAVKA